MVDSREKNSCGSIDCGYEGKLEANGFIFRVVTAYLLAGVSWIFLSDSLLDMTVSDKKVLVFICIAKGLGYVLVSALLFFYLLYRAQQKIEKAEGELFARNKELASAHRSLSSSTRKYQLQLQYSAYHDFLTGLPNRNSFIGEAPGILNNSNHSIQAIMFVDCDDFRYVNDALGHSVGDLVIAAVSQKMSSLLTRDCRLYRLGDDEFVILAGGFGQAGEIELLAECIITGFMEPLQVSGSSLYISVSIGVAICPLHGTDRDTLMKNADIALNKAKEASKSRFVIYSPEMNDAIAERVIIEKHLHTALNANEFELYYQPQIDLPTGKIAGFEALLRWKSPVLGLVPPLKFIKIAEDTNMIIKLGEWVLEEACFFNKRLIQAGFEDCLISVNISIIQLLQKDFTDMVLQKLKKAGLSPGQLEIEITESILMESIDAIGQKLQFLRRLGVGIALDDFGKGYSSLNYIKKLPITTIKIDKTFVDDISGEAVKKEDLAGAIMSMGQMIGLCVVAEGVETREQWDYLVKNNCNRIQGYIISKPLPEEKAIQLCVKAQGREVSFPDSGLVYKA
ncbi:MAG TPA: diguanylate cyclase [Desulfotomaculum sp.]|nr:diguanylate cyclase [Desulfotomaculum sp.]